MPLGSSAYIGLGLAPESGRKDFLRTAVHRTLEKDWRDRLRGDNVPRLNWNPQVDYGWRRQPLYEWQG